MKLTLLIALFFITTKGFSQEKEITYFKNGIENPSLLTTHHFGIFSSRINSNFKHHVPKKGTFSFNYSSGNTFHPFVEAYLPKNEAIKAQFSNQVWHNRHFNFIDQETTPAEYMNIVIDAVIKEFRVQLNIPISKQQELDITLRSYLFTKGKYPFSIFAGDEFIEWFHSNVAGGEDPFGRKYYGLNQVNFKYTDRNGKVLELHENDFILGGLEFNHYYYPNLLKHKNIYLNIGSHIGINTSSFNSSIDIGFSGNIIKNYILKNKNELNISFGTSILKKNTINFGSSQIDLGNNTLLGNFESEIEFTKYTPNKNYHSFGLHYQFQTRYNQFKETNYYHLKGKWQEINAGWQNGFATLYQGLSAWTFLYSYGKPNLKVTLYLKEDLLVNNAPDVQTGISIQIPISKK